MASVAVDLFTAPTAGLPSKPTTKATYVLTGFHVASQRRPKTCIGFSRWAPTEPAARVPRPERDHWAKMKIEGACGRMALPKLPSSEIHRVNSASKLNMSGLASKPDVPSAEIASPVKQDSVPPSAPVPAPELLVPLRNNVSVSQVASAPDRNNFGHRGLVRSKSARESTMWNNRYHLRAKQGYRYWFEDPDETPKRISDYAKYGTPFGSHKTFFGLGFSPRK